MEAAAFKSLGPTPACPSDTASAMASSGMMPRDAAGEDAAGREAVSDPTLLGAAEGAAAEGGGADTVGRRADIPKEALIVSSSLFLLQMANRTR